LEVLSPGNLPFRMNLRPHLYSPLSKSYFQWGGGSSGENVPWWLPSGLLSQPIRIGLIRVGRSFKEGGRCSGTTTTNKSGSAQRPYHPVITGRPVPLSGLPRPDTVRPHRWSDGVGPNILDNLTQSLTTVFSHRRYASIRNSEVSLPLHTWLGPLPPGLTYPVFLPFPTDPIRLQVVESNYV
jgi:hypothetical protein